MSQIITHKTDLMRRLLHLASHGYDYWISGEIQPTKVEALAFKFLDRYHTNRTEMKRYRAKKRGEANTQLVMWQDQKDKKSPVYWWLLVTPGVFKQTASKFHRILSKMLIYKEYRSFPTSHL